MEYNTEDLTLHPVVSDIVEKIKADGIFDVLRKECLADVDSKPAYQNLKQKVENACSRFLHQIIWTPTLNKNQIREQLRNEINSMGFINSSVGRIVNQVVTPKIDEEIRPKVENVVKEYYGYNDEQENEELNMSYNSLPVDTSQPPPSISLYPFNPYEAPPQYAAQPPLPGFEGQQTTAVDQTEDQLADAGVNVENRAEEPMEMSDDERSDDKTENNEEAIQENTEMENKGGDLAQGLADYMKEESSTTPSEPQGDDMSISTPSNEDDSRPSSQATSIQEEGETNSVKDEKKGTEKSRSRTAISPLTVPARRESRRQRTRNRKYFDDDFTSIFTERKDLLSESYTNQVVTEEVVTMDTDATIQLEEETVIDVAQIIEPTLALSDIKSQTFETNTLSDCGAEALVFDGEANLDVNSGKNDNGISENNAESVLGRKPVKFTINTRRSLMASKSEDQIESPTPSRSTSASSMTQNQLQSDKGDNSETKSVENNLHTGTSEQKLQNEKSNIQKTEINPPRRSTRIQSRHDSIQSAEKPESNKQTMEVVLPINTVPDQSESTINREPDQSESISDQPTVSASSDALTEQPNSISRQTGNVLNQSLTDISVQLHSSSTAVTQGTLKSGEDNFILSETVSASKVESTVDQPESPSSVDMEISDEDENSNNITEIPSVHQISVNSEQTVREIPTDSETTLHTDNQSIVLGSNQQNQKGSSEIHCEPTTRQEELTESSEATTAASAAEPNSHNEGVMNEPGITEQIHVGSTDEKDLHQIEEAECPASPTPSDQRGELDESEADEVPEGSLELKEIEELERLAKKKMEILKAIKIPDTVDISLRRSTVDNFSSEEEEGEITGSSDDSREAKKKKSKKKSSKKKKKKESKKRKRHLDEVESREAKRIKHRTNY